MRTGELHVHTTFCDGSNTPEEMVLAALDKHMDRIGFTAHSFTPEDTSYCLSEENYPKYLAEIRRLKEKYSGRIRILCGIEQDYFASIPVDAFDYAIGSVHYLPTTDGIVPIDMNAEELRTFCKRYFNGDGIALAEKYFEYEANIIAVTNADIIGHFDVISKFNEDHSFFDPADPRYIAAWKKASDRLLQTGKPFEINSGAMFKGYRTEPYPALDIQQYLLEKGAGFIRTNDCHCTEAVGWEPQTRVSMSDIEADLPF